MTGDTQKDPPVLEPEPDDEDELLDEGLEESFPASDPPSAAQPHPYWDTHPETD